MTSCQTLFPTAPWRSLLVHEMTRDNITNYHRTPGHKKNLRFYNGVVTFPFLEMADTIRPHNPLPLRLFVFNSETVF